ncbi:MAG: DNA-directed RNA polymerase subunit alpha C-terminal domain-containing protein [Christensenellales bacterium]
MSDLAAKIQDQADYLPMWLEGVPPLVLSASIEKLNLSAPLCNCLYRAKMRTVGEAAAHSKHWLFTNVRNMSEKMVNELAETLDQVFGIRLPGYSTEEVEELRIKAEKPADEKTVDELMATGRPSWLLGVPKAVLLAPVGNLDCLSQKTVQTLAAHGIKLVVQLAAGSQYHLAKRLENVGFDTIRHIADSLKERLDIALPSYTPQEERRIRWEIENEWS